MIKWVVHDLLAGSYTVGYKSGRVLTYAAVWKLPITVINFITEYSYSAHVGKNITVYES